LYNFVHALACLLDMFIWVALFLL